MGVIKWQLNFVSCNFGLKSYLWFQIERALVWFDFEITHIISDQIELHSDQLPLLIIALSASFFRENFGSPFSFSWLIAR